MSYFEEADVLHLNLADGPDVSSVELSPNVTAELNADGGLVGLEILNASDFLRDLVLDSAQANSCSWQSERISEPPRSLEATNRRGPASAAGRRA
ncbi:MAG: DUF2283 domain-containing protein [Acidobacteriota bacterium]